MLLSVRHMASKDIDKVVAVHMCAFPNFFLTFLGRRFLYELYAGILQDSSGIAFVLEAERGVCGFVAGTTQPAGLYKRLLKQRWWRFAVAASGAAARRPEIIPRLLRAFTVPSSKAKHAECALLMSIAALPDVQGQHGGRALVTAFLCEARRRGSSSVALETDRDNNERVNAFYLNYGFILVNSIVTPEGRRMNEYEIALDSIPLPCNSHPD